MKVVLESIVSYRVKTADGKDLGVFNVDSKWEGLIHLVDDEKRHLILDAPNPMSQSISAVFGGGVEVDVLKASASLMPDLAGEPTP